MKAGWLGIALVVMAGISFGAGAEDKPDGSSGKRSSDNSVLHGFENSVPSAPDANKPSRQEERHESRHGAEARHEDEKPDAFSAMLAEMFVDAIADGGRRSLQRVSSGYAAGLDDFTPSSPRVNGEPLIPFVRYDFALQRVSGDVSAHMNRVEGGYGPVGVYLEDYSFFEKSSQSTLDFKRSMVLYRMAGDTVEIDFGAGQTVMTGLGRKVIDAFLLRSRFRINENVTVDFQPVWGTGLDDYEFALSYGWQYGAFKAGYRSLNSPTATLSGFFAGATLYF
jgi:hypothetical protein